LPANGDGESGGTSKTDAKLDEDTDERVRLGVDAGIRPLAGTKRSSERNKATLGARATRPVVRGCWCLGVVRSAKS
jgi:hypothetical protein